MSSSSCGHCRTTCGCPCSLCAQGRAPRQTVESLIEHIERLAAYHSRRQKRFVIGYVFDGYDEWGGSEKRLA